MNNTGTKYVRIMKQTAFSREKTESIYTTFKIFSTYIYKTQRLEVSCAVRPLYGSLGVKGLNNRHACVMYILYGLSSYEATSMFEKSGRLRLV